MSTLAFDVYGTLIDTAGVVDALSRFVGDRAKLFSDTWRAKQLEYSFRRGLMKNYRDFSVCTKDALEYACSAFQANISSDDKEKLLSGYQTLPTHPDVADALSALQSDGHRLFAFSNGRSDDVERLLKHTGIDCFFLDIISTDEVKSFKPNPEVYAHFLRRAGSVKGESWLVSGNPFDVIGAISAGMKAAWVKRSPGALFDPWGIEPTVTVDRLTALPIKIG
ncbi:MAG: haloacid dehalogenase type II [Nitrospinota bacterium]